MSDVIKCFKCNSENWRCVDEQNHYYTDDDGEIFVSPVGYLICTDCGARWQDHNVDAEHIGDDDDLEDYLYGGRYHL